ncbi:hypothetical protein [Rubripirellula lacrimiformis]|nr:hypothetical protein [Rubripirellula lacrimiformis]
MIRIATVIVLLSTLMTSPSSALADDNAPLYLLAQQYRNEVKAFERAVLHVRGIDRFDERLVDRWDDETGRLLVPAKNPRHFNRLFHQWKKVESLQAQTEARIFGKYTPHHELIGHWNRVLLAQDYFMEEFVLHVENPGHTNSVRRLDRPSARRDSYLSPSALATPVIPGAAVLRSRIDIRNFPGMSATSIEAAQ